MSAIREERLTAHGLELQVLRGGEGPALLLLHADGDSALDWRWVLEPLARDYSVLAPSLPGHGDSAQPSEYHPQFFVNVLRGLLDAVGIERVTAVGNSFGGLLATRLAVQEPERVRALCLVDSAGLGHEVHPLVIAEAWPAVGEWLTLVGRSPLLAWQRARLRQLLIFADPSRAPDAWLDDQRRLPQRPAYWPTTISARRFVLGPFGQRDLILDELAALRVPALVIWGDRDAVLPRSHALAALARLAHGRESVIADSGHLPHVEQPERFLDALLPFLAERPEE
ncbi:MAG: alpha/beta fold hydrolase [Actinomycetota bacterium]|nr:alpha/beta fold hydrolase [Actinomycetota bacterium]